MAKAEHLTTAAVALTAVIPAVYGYHGGMVSFEAGALILLGTIALTTAFIAGTIMNETTHD